VADHDLEGKTLREIAELLAIRRADKLVQRRPPGTFDLLCGKRGGFFAQQEG